MIAARESGLDTFHGGGVVIDGRLWAILGSKLGGKTTALAWFASNGFSVTSDDLVVLDGDTSLSGPGCLDLRAGAAHHLSMGERQALVAGRVRWRVWLPSPAATVPFGGFVLPEWGEDIRVSAPAGSERLRLLIEHRAAQTTHGRETRLLELLSRPMVRWQRPRDFTRLDEAGSALIAAVRAHSESSSPSDDSQE